jgi:aspartate aminotransferase
LVSGGSRPLIYATFKTIVDEGDKVVYAVPSWNNNHYAYLTSANAVELEVSPEDNFLPTADVITPHLEGAVLLAQACNALDTTLEEIMQMNINKLMARYPEGFSFERSINRNE